MSLLTQLANQPVYDQRRSPLFGVVPPEIRTIIFRWALLASYDRSHPFATDAYYYRPDFLYRDKIDTALLRTCRQVYLETSRLPVALNDHVFWCGRGPTTGSVDPERFFRSLTKEQSESVDRVHLFTQMFWLEGNSFKGLVHHPKFRPRSLHITVRHSDWWCWEDNNALVLHSEWTASLKNVTGLEELVLELETIDRDKDQMYAIAERISKLKINLKENRVLDPSAAPTKGQWMGPSAYREGNAMLFYEGGRWRHNFRHAKPATTVYPPMVYQTIKLRWHATRRA